MSRLVLDPDRWQQLKADNDITSDAEAARILGVDQSTVSRAVNGATIGGALLAALWSRWPDEFPEVVKVTEAAS